MGITTRVKRDMDEKKPFNFALFWDKYGTFFILAIIVAIFGTLSSEYFLTTNNITQIFVQSSVTVLIGMGEFFAILVAGIDLSVGAILALSGMVTAKLMRRRPVPGSAHWRRAGWRCVRRDQRLSGQLDRAASVHYHPGH